MYKNNRLIYFIVNCLLILALLIRFPSWVGAISSVAIGALLYVALFNQNNISKHASGDILTIAFFDILSILGIAFNNLVEYWGNHISEQYNFDARFTFLVGLVLIGGGILFLIGIARKATHILSIIGGTLVVFAVSYLCFGYDDTPYLKSTGIFVLAISVIVFWAWCYCASISLSVDSEKNTRISWMTVFVVIFEIFLLIFERDFVLMCVESFSSHIISPEVKLFSWWRVLIWGIISVAGALFTRIDFEGDNNEVDSLIMLASGAVVIVLETITEVYFSFNILLLIAFLALVKLCVKNEIKNQKTFRVGNSTLIIYASILIPIAANLIANGLFGFVAVTAAFSIVYYSEFIEKTIARKPTIFWLCVLSTLFFETIAWIWIKRYCSENIIMLSVAYVLAIFAMIILCWKHPNKQASPVFIKVTVCVLLGVLCLIPMIRFGVDVNIEMSVTDNTLTISSEANSKKTEVATLEYYWLDHSGKRQCDNRTLSETNSIAIESECLKVIAVDSKGVQTTHLYWYPFMLHNLCNDALDEIAYAEKQIENYLSEHYVIDARTKINGEGIIELTLPSTGQNCVITYNDNYVQSDSDISISSSDVSDGDIINEQFSTEIDVIIRDSANKDAEDYFDIKVDEENKTISLRLKKTPRSNLYTLTIVLFSYDGIALDAADVELVVGKRDSIVVYDEHFEGKDGKYTIRSKASGMRITIGEDEDGWTDIFMSESGTIWQLSENTNEKYLLLGQGEYNYYLSGDSSVYYQENEDSDAEWEIQACWRLGSGMSFAIVKRDESGKVSYLVSDDDGIWLTENDELSDLYLWSFERIQEES